jgi:NTP pyrophosphatase (non-canonical NTP hydrolase)
MKEVKKIEWSDFVNGCMSTCTPKCESLEYLIPGLKSEVGEIYGVIAKYVRGDFNEETFIKRIKSEVGDVMWFLGVLSRVLERERDIDYITESPIITKEIVMDQVISFVDELDSYYIGTKWLLLPISTLNKLCDSVGFTLYDAMNGVLVKLKNRKENGTIQGDGESCSERLSNVNNLDKGGE